MRTWNVLGLVGLVALITTQGGCGGGGGSSPPLAGEIGPAGGTATSPEGASVVVPPGALASQVPIKIAKDATGVAPLPSVPGLQAVGDIFALTPHGTIFSAPVTVSLPFDPALVPAGAQVVLLKTDSSLANWAVVAGATVSGTHVAGRVSSFSGTVPARAFPPLITVPPADQAVAAGQTATFSVSAVLQTGGVIVYAWERSSDGGTTWAPIAGATAPIYTTPATVAADDGTLFRARAGLLGLAGVEAISSAARLTVGGGGYLYVTDRVARWVVRMTGGMAGTWKTVSANAPGTDHLTSPWGIFVDAAGKIYVTDGSRFVQTDINGTTWNAVPGKAGGSDPFFSLEGIAVDGAGMIYVTDWGGPAQVGRVVRTDLAGQAWAVLGGTAGTGVRQFTCPGLIFVDGADLYVADRCNSRVVKTGTDMTGARWQVLTMNQAGTDHLTDPRAVWVVGTTLYIADELNSRLVITGTDMSGTVWTPIPFPGIVPPTAVTVAPSGDIYAASYRSPLLVRVDPVSHALTTFTAGPGGETFQATDGVFFR